MFVLIGTNDAEWERFIARRGKNVAARQSGKMFGAALFQENACEEPLIWQMHGTNRRENLRYA